MDPKEGNRGFELDASVGDNSESQPKMQIKISAQTAKDIESLMRRVEFRPSSSRQDPQITADGHFVIDPEIRQRIAHPKYPIRMPDRPFENLSFNDGSRRDYLNYTPGPNVSRVNGMFGRKWREMIEKQQEREYAEEDQKNANESALSYGDNICPTFMIWGTCHRGDRCELRHPSYRYLERPKRAEPSPAPEPEPVQEEPKPRDPRSYAAVLEKTKSSENVGFCNDALSKERTSEDNLEEEWPALGSPGNEKAPKSWWLKSNTVNVPKAWDPKNVSQNGPAVEGPTSRLDQVQIASDQLIAETLQVDEYAQLSEYNDDDYYYPDTADQELNEDEYYYEQVEDTPVEDDNSFDVVHEESKATHVEQFNSFNSSPVIMENTPERAEEPDQIELSTTCDICMDRPKDATLVCGHRFCYQCALQMRLDERVCAICRRCIVSVIKTYN